MSDTIRYSRMTDFMQLLHMMLAEPSGVSLNDICVEFNVSRRTAERMRDAICNEFPQVDVVSEGGKIKRLGFINYSMREIVSFTDAEIFAIQSLKSHPELNSILYKMKVLRKRISKTNCCFELIHELFELWYHLFFVLYSKLRYFRLLNLLAAFHKTF